MAAKRTKLLLKMDSVDLLPPEPEDEEPSLTKSILRVLNGPARDSIERLAFETDPKQRNTTAGIYKPKRGLIPDAMLKRIAIQDDLVASIVNARGKQLSGFGRPRADRFSTGFVIEPAPGVVEKMDADNKAKLDARLKAAVVVLNSCGSEENLSRRDQCTFSQWLEMSTKNAVTVGRIATEIIWGRGMDANEPVFARFRAIDAGTIYQAANYKDSAVQVRDNAVRMLETLKQKRLKEEQPLRKDQIEDIAWAQVNDGDVLQVFTDQECIVHTFYPVSDIEMDGYPVTPIDTMLAAVTTHINITTHNKIYFQTGRATRGMLVITSEEADEAMVGRIKQQFNASINSVNNAWRMPVFAVGANDKIEWQPIDNSSRDMEFQYLTDMNARVILSAFQMSPDELPGWTYLSRGTNNQSLSESNNEYKLEAARDLGIRPLIAGFEDFINNAIFPLIDSELSKICRIRLVGLEAETAEKEAVRIQQDMPIHMTYDQVLEKVEKKPVGESMGGSLPLNPQYMAGLEKYRSFGFILENYFGVKGAAHNPQWDFIQNPMWFQYQQMLDQRKQMAAQAQMAQAQAQQQSQQGGGGSQGGGGEDPAGAGVSDTAQPGGGGGGDSGGGDEPASKKPYDDPSESEKTEQAQAGAAPASGGQDLTRSLDQAIGVLTKGEEDLPPSKRRILQQHRLVLKQAMADWERELLEATKAITDVAGKFVRKKD